MDIFEGMKIAIVIAAIYASVTQFWQAKKMFDLGISSAWVHFGLGVFMLYWGLYYARSSLDFVPFNAHQIYIRAPLLITIVLVGAAGAYGIRRIK